MALITDLPTNASPASSDYMITDNGSTTSKSTIENVKTSMGLNMSGISTASVGVSSSKTLTVANSSKILLVTLASPQASKGLYLINATSSGAVSVASVLAGANITLTGGTNTLTIANNSSSAALVYYCISLAGSAT